MTIEIPKNNYSFIIMATLNIRKIWILPLKSKHIPGLTKFCRGKEPGMHALLIGFAFKGYDCFSCVRREWFYIVGYG